MAKTALDLTKQEWQGYHPDKGIETAESFASPSNITRRQEAFDVARKAAQILRDRFGAGKVVVFGSLALGEITRWSDVDLAAWDIPPDRFYAAVAAVTDLSRSFQIDLIDAKTCKPSVREILEVEGIEL